MPLIHYSCPDGHGVSKFFRQAKDAPAFFTCTCQKESKKQLKAPSSTSKITIDNGVQARAVEVNPDIVEINRERANKDYTEE